MNNYLKRFTESLFPFVILGISIALFIGLFIMFSYLLLWGLFIGVICWALFMIKEYFFPKKPKTTTQGRIIEHNDNENK